MPTPPPAKRDGRLLDFPVKREVIDAVGLAAELLDKTDHRLVEMHGPCPAGCQWAEVNRVVIDGRDTPLVTPTWAQIAGPSPCPHSCTRGVIEDENAPWLDAPIEHLRLFHRALLVAQYCGATIPGANNDVCHHEPGHDRLELQGKLYDHIGEALAWNGDGRLPRDGKAPDPVTVPAVSVDDDLCRSTIAWPGDPDQFVRCQLERGHLPPGIPDPTVGNRPWHFPAHAARWPDENPGRSHERTLGAYWINAKVVDVADLPDYRPAALYEPYDSTHAMGPTIVHRDFGDELLEAETRAGGATVRNCSWHNRRRQWVIVHVGFRDPVGPRVGDVCTREHPHDLPGGAEPRSTV